MTEKHPGRIIHRTEPDEAKFHIRFKGIEVYYEYDSIRSFLNDWMDFDEWLEDIDRENNPPIRKSGSNGNRNRAK